MGMTKEELFEMLAADCALMENVPPATHVMVHEEGRAIEILLDRSSDYYSERIKGEGLDISLYRDMETHRVVGARLPLTHERLTVSRIRKPAAGSGG